MASFVGMARMISRGSRLSAVRLAQVHGACDVPGMRRGFDENDLYANQKWLSERQGKIQDCLFQLPNGGRAPQLFLYDVTSTYLEGEKNAFGDYGYSRDGKRGKKQIVVGLLCDEEGEPVSTEVFRGNTANAATFASQVRKAAERFGCRRVTFVGDRGMLKSGQIEQLSREGFHYITAITKPQIKALVARGVIQMDLFEEELCEVQDEGVRYVLRRNPCRAKDMAAARADKQRCVERLVEKQNGYLRHHPRARVSTAQKTVREKIERLPQYVLEVLKASPSPMTAAEIADAVIKAGYRSSSKNFVGLVRRTCYLNSRIHTKERGKFTIKSRR